MSKTTAALLVVPALAALAWSAVQARGLRDEVRELRERLARVEARPKAAAAAPDAEKAVDDLRAEIARVEAKVVAAPPRPGALPITVTEEDIRKIVDERLEEKKADPAAKKEGGFGGDDRKMPLHDMSKELALDPETQRRVGEIANRTKREIFDVLKTPRPDGTEMAGDLIGAFLSGDGEKTKAVFGRLFTEKVPGGDQTYLVAVTGIQERAKQQLRGTMGDALYGRFEHMNVRPENIETGWDPWGEYVKEKGLTPK
ncbi:MAG TPA: hypothetical protein VF950_10210 [Planctomycetota bacterium]